MSTFLEFNRDLFLCNSIHDPENLADIIPIKMSDGSLFKRNVFTDPLDNQKKYIITDQHDKVFILPKNYITDDDNQLYKTGYFPNNSVIYEFTMKERNMYNSSEELDKKKKMGVINKWKDDVTLRINYLYFANNQNDYISPENNIDIWIGSGYIDLSRNVIENPPTIIKGTAGTRGGSTTYSSSFSLDPSDKNIAKEMQKKLDAMQDLQNDLTTLRVSLKDKSDVDKKINELQSDINDLKKKLASYKDKKSLKNSKSSNTFGTEGTPDIEINENDVRFVYSVKGGALVKYQPNKVGDCDKYKMTSVCPINPDNPQEQQNCEICKNFNYRDWYDENNQTNINRNARYEDSTTEYVYTWLQTWNLGIGISIMVYGIYYQLS